MGYEIGFYLSAVVGGRGGGGGGGGVVDAWYDVWGVFEGEIQNVLQVNDE